MQFPLMALAIAAAFGAPGTAWSAKAPPNIPAEQTERDAAAESTFRSLDTNHNGYVSREEAMSSADLNRRFNELDKDRDGRLSPQELTGWRRPSTTGSTGSSSKRTVAAAGDRPYSSRPAPSRPRNPVDRSASDPGAGTFKSFDVNSDGYVSRDEAKESAELNRRFKELDQNGDGKLSLHELTGWRSSYSRLARAEAAAFK